MSQASYPAVVSLLRTAGCVFAEEEADLLFSDGRTDPDVMKLARRRAGGEPLEYVLGWAQFCGLRIQVDSGVFVPRRRTQFLAEVAIANLDSKRLGSVVVDMCCGTGAVGVAVLESRPGIDLIATDICAIAVACTRRNLPVSSVFRGDLFSALPRVLRGKVQLLVANAPYVPTPAIRMLPSEARDYEPLFALDGGADGLEVQRAILKSATEWLAPGGVVAVETSREQAARTVGLFQEAGLHSAVWESERWDATVVLGRWMSTDNQQPG